MAKSNIVVYTHYVVECTKAVLNEMLRYEGSKLIKDTIAWEDPYRYAEGSGLDYSRYTCLVKGQCNIKRWWSFTGVRTISLITEAEAARIVKGGFDEPL